MDRRYIENKAARVKVEKREDGTARIVGYGAVYYDGTPGTEFRLWDGAVERIMPGAFDRAVKEDDVRGLFNHDPNMLLGRTSAGTMRLSIDDTGLLYDIDADPKTRAGRDVPAMIDRKDLQGSSFSFTVTDQTWARENETDIREVRGVRLFDTGPVTFPAYEATTTGLRAEIMAEARDAYRMWNAARAIIEAQAAAARARALELESA